MRGTMKAVLAALIAACWSILCAPAVSAKSSAAEPSGIQISYVSPSNPALRGVYERLKEHRLLERVRDYLSPLRLPRTLHLKTDECDGEANAWYEESDRTVTVCYEYIEDALRSSAYVPTAAPVPPQDAIIGPTIEVLLHETGHAIFHLLKVPILGREEDAADQIAAYMILHLDKDIARETVLEVAFIYKHEALSQDHELEHFADVHGVSAQRFYNLLCMAYGRDPALFADLVEKKYLPKSRAESCADEYRQVDYAFGKLIFPHIDQARARAMRSRKPLRFAPK